MDPGADTSFKPRLVVALLTVGFQAACISSPESYVARGNAFFAKGQYEEASLNYRKAAQKDPKLAEAYHRLGLSEFAQGRTQEAFASESQARQLAPENTEILQDLADVTFNRYLATGRTQALYNASTRLVSELLRKNPTSAVGLRLHASILYGDGKLKDAITEFQKADSASPFDPAVLLPLADALRLDDCPDEAEKTALRLLEHKPEFAAGYDWLAQQYISTGRLPDAERILKSRLEKNPHDPSAVLTLASFYRTQKRDKDADGTIQAMMARPKDFPDPYTVAGDFYVTGRNWQQAEHYFQAGLAARPSAKSAYLTKLAAVSLAQNRIPDALKSLNDAIKAKPDDWDAQSLRIETLIASKDKKQLDEAIAAAQGLIKRQPRNPRLPYLLANAYLAKGDEKSAVAAYQQAAAIGKQVLAPRLALARISKEKRDAAGMLRYSGEVLAVNPREPDARLIHADGLAAQGNFAEADREMSALVKDSPESAEVRSDAALLFLREKRTRMAIEAFQALLAARPDDQRALAGLTTAYMQQGSWDEAIRVVDNEVKRDPTSAPKRLLLSAVALRLRRPELALQQYQALAQAHPESADYQFELGQLYAAMGEKKKAIAGYEAAVRLGTPDANRLGVLAIAYHAAGMEQEADAAYSGALKLRPSDPILLNDRAYFLAESGKNPDEAIQLAKTALQHLPDNPALMDTLALSYIAKDMIPDATAILNPLVRAHPDEPMFRYHLAMALLRSGGRDEARKQLQISLRKRPARDDEGRIKELLARLG